MTTKKGRDFEEKAVQSLSALGLVVIDRNIHTPYGEIDIVALDGDTLCIVEVKGRTSPSEWDIDCIPRKKQIRIAQSVEYFLMNNDSLPTFDEMELCAFYWTKETPTFLRNAFDGL